MAEVEGEQITCCQNKISQKSAIITTDDSYTEQADEEDDANDEYQHIFDGTDSGHYDAEDSDEDDHYRTSIPNPYVAANWISKLTLWWMAGLFLKGFKWPLKVEDICESKQDDDTREDSVKLTRCLTQCNTAARGQRKKTLMSLVMQHYKTQLIYITILRIWLDTMRLGFPVMIAHIVGYMAGTNSLTREQAYLLCGALGIISLTYTFPLTQYTFMVYDVSMKARATVVGMVYMKLLKLDLASVHKCTSGRIVNLMATDAELVFMAMLNVQELWMAPAISIVTIVLLFIEFGLPFLPGLLIAIALLILECVVGIKVGSYRTLITKWTDKRNSMMNDIIGGIKMIKIFCWEYLFSDVTDDYRKKEISSIHRARMIEAQAATIYFSCHKIIMLSTVVSCVLMNQGMSTSQAIKLIGWLEFLRAAAFGLFPRAVLFNSEMYWSLERIQTFIEMDEKSTIPHNEDGEFILSVFNVTSGWKMTSEFKERQQDNRSFKDDKILDIPYTEEETYFMIQNIDIHVKKNQLTVIIGEVGSGKSSLLMAVLGEMPLESGDISVSGSVAYVPQDAWVFNATIEENITMGQKKENHDTLYKNAILSSSLGQDMKLMPEGDQTLVGERGWTLSGGQKTRLNLSRAVYADCDVYLLDDPLSALDSTVSQEVFSNCICGTLSHTARILVTHQLQFLESNHIDKILLMSKGKIVASGSYKEISQLDDYQKLASVQNINTTTVQRRAVESLQMPIEMYNLIGDATSAANVCNNKKVKFEVKQTPRSLEWSVWMAYMKAGRGVYLIPLTALLSAMVLVVTILGDWILLNWTSVSETRLESSNGTSVFVNSTSNNNITDSLGNSTAKSPSANDLWFTSDEDFLLALGLLVFGGVVFSSAFSMVYFTFAVTAGKVLHNEMFAKVMRAPMSFFERNPVGRILNRFSRDLGFVDGPLPRNTVTVYIMLSNMLGQIVFVAYSNALVIAICVPVFVLMILLRQFAIRTIRDFRRLEAEARTPLYSQLSDTIRGLPVVRSLDKDELFQNQFHHLQTRHTTTWFLYTSSNRWLSLHIEWLVSACLISCVFIAMGIDSGGAASEFGLGLSYLVLIVYNTQFVLFQMTEVETMMTAVERICEYHKLEKEADLTFVSRNKLPENWPENGQITVQNLSMSYVDAGVEALKNICFTVRSREKIGIVGRTGSGKSTLLSCLLRLVDYRGSIVIDGVDISTLGLHQLRRRISVIPQDPILLTGTLRRNMDPFGQYTDDEIWNALEKVHMKDSIISLGSDLSSEVHERGSNFSTGQQQLLCLARALLQNNKILLVDEATANVDNRTDTLVQDAIQTVFQDCTILTIAHRLNTIINSDCILVLSEGTIVESDHPHLLLQNLDSVFSHMVKELGDQQILELRTIAAENYERLTTDAVHCSHREDIALH